MVVGGAEADQGDAAQQDEIGGALPRFEKSLRVAERAQNPDGDEEEGDVGDYVPEIRDVPDCAAIGEQVVGGVLGDGREQEHRDERDGSETENEDLAQSGG